MMGVNNQQEQYFYEYVIEKTREFFINELGDEHEYAPNKPNADVCLDKDGRLVIERDLTIYGAQAFKATISSYIKGFAKTTNSDAYQLARIFQNNTMNFPLDNIKSCQLVKIAQSAELEKVLKIDTPLSNIRRPEDIIKILIEEEMYLPPCVKVAILNSVAAQGCIQTVGKGYSLNNIVKGLGRELLAVKVDLSPKVKVSKKDFTGFNFKVDPNVKD
ncbi:MAG: hypothetical protein FWD32_00405 [Firmicutes bacterium]|nr:hypothetical protein [Bacillota bacterium]